MTNYMKRIRITLVYKLNPVEAVYLNSKQNLTCYFLYEVATWVLIITKDFSFSVMAA